jgi:hypothetical protein
LGVVAADRTLLGQQIRCPAVDTLIRRFAHGHPVPAAPSRHTPGPVLTRGAGLDRMGW